LRKEDNINIMEDELDGFMAFYDINEVLDRVQNQDLTFFQEISSISRISSFEEGSKMEDEPAAYDLNEVLDRVQNQDPTVTGVKVYFDEDSDADDDDPPTIDWYVAAKCISESRYLNYLSLSAVFELGEGVHNNDSMIQFCNGLAGNKSIDRLDLCIANLEYSVDTERLFELHLKSQKYVFPNLSKFFAPQLGLI
jgi:hypothetical protein